MAKPCNIKVYYYKGKLSSNFSYFLSFQFLAAFIRRFSAKITPYVYYYKYRGKICFSLEKVLEICYNDL